MTDLGHNKLNLGLSGFRQDDGSIFVPPTTRSVERSMHMRGGLSHDALPIEGHPPFLDLGVKFAYGKDGHAFKDGRVSLDELYNRGISNYFGMIADRCGASNVVDGCPSDWIDLLVPVPGSADTKNDLYTKSDRRRGGFRYSRLWPGDSFVPILRQANRWCRLGGHARGFAERPRSVDRPASCGR